MTVEGDTPAARATSARVAAIGFSSGGIQPAGTVGWYDDGVRGIHGIRPADVADAADWTTQLAGLTAFIGDDVLVAHNAGFDMTVLRRACEVTDAQCPPYRYVCSLQVSRKTYDLASYRLPLVAAAAGFLDFAHHDATADALACAHIMIDAAQRAGAQDVVELAMLLGLRVPQIPAAAPAVTAAV